MQDDPPSAVTCDDRAKSAEKVRLWTYSVVRSDDPYLGNTEIYEYKTILFACWKDNDEILVEV